MSWVQSIDVVNKIHCLFDIPFVIWFVIFVNCATWLKAFTKFNGHVLTNNLLLRCLELEI